MPPCARCGRRSAWKRGRCALTTAITSPPPTPSCSTSPSPWTMRKPTPTGRWTPGSGSRLKRQGGRSSPAAWPRPSSTDTWTASGTSRPDRQHEKAQKRILSSPFLCFFYYCAASAFCPFPYERTLFHACETFLMAASNSFSVIVDIMLPSISRKVEAGL